MIKYKKLKLAGHVTRMEEGKSTLKMLTGKPTEKKNLGRPRRRWDENIRICSKEIDVHLILD